MHRRSVDKCLNIIQMSDQPRRTIQRVIAILHLDHSERRCSLVLSGRRGRRPFHSDHIKPRIRPLCIAIDILHISDIVIRRVRDRAMPIILPYDDLLELPLILPILREPDIHRMLIQRDMFDRRADRRICRHPRIILRIERERIANRAAVNAEETAAAIVNIRRVLPSKFQIKGIIILHVHEQFVKRATLLKIVEHLCAQCSLNHAPHLSLSSKEYCFYSIKYDYFSFNF